MSSEPDIFKVQLRKEHKHLVIACDGVWDVLDDQVYSLFSILDSDHSPSE